MSDTGEEDYVPHPADPPAPLVNFVNSFQDEQARDIMRDAAVRIQDYTTRREIADNNTAAAHRLVSNLGQFQDGLASMAYQDPAAVSLGLDLVPDIVHGLIHTNPFLDDNDRGGMIHGVTNDIQREIARAGVMSLAEKDAAAARALLDNNRVSSLFVEQDMAGLTGYISAMDKARGMDAAAVARQRAEDERRTLDYSMAQHLNGLVDPQTGELAFPGGWAQRVIADPSLPPAQSAGMLGLYDRLQKGGDVPSDPYVLADTIAGIASGGVRGTAGILSQVGSSLSANDAVALSYAALNATPEARQEVQVLAATIDAARRTLAAPENGPAGHSAFGRFISWLVPSYRQAGAGSLHPEAENTIVPPDAPLWDRFAPNGTDIVAAARGMTYGPEGFIEPPARPSLDQILGPRRR